MEFTNNSKIILNDENIHHNVLETSVVVILENQDSILKIDGIAMNVFLYLNENKECLFSKLVKHFMDIHKVDRVKDDIAKFLNQLIDYKIIQVK